MTLTALKSLPSPDPLPLNGQPGTSAKFQKSLTIHPGSLPLIEMLGMISDFLDPAVVEEQFFRLVDELFPFDRVAFFFVKHGKGVLQGKLSRGFAAHLPEEVEVSLAAGQPLAELLTSGLPYHSADGKNEVEMGVLEILQLRNFAFIPIIKRKNLPCWKIEECTDTDCPAHGKSWLRCWHIPGTRCPLCRDSSSAGKADGCAVCPIFSSFERLEGMLLVDNSLSGNPISNEAVAALSVVSQMVALAVCNSKQFQKTLASAIRDELTGLYNRRYFNERLQEEIERSRRDGGIVSLISCDIDQFKRLNDSHGHPAGDRVLALLGTILRNSLRKSDVIARYGGEEFMILMPDTPKEQAWKTAEKLRQHIAAAEIDYGRTLLRITVSFGVASFAGEGDSIEKLLDKVDKALYTAKFGGRNQVCVV
ncbi:MAG: GGDEF domain-containing protein [Desulfurivibrionaceae bacterium]